jgi:hypothetical protein
METARVDERWFPGVTDGYGLEQWSWPGLAGGHVIQRKDGDLPGFISVMQLVPDLGFAVVALVNAGGGTVPTADDISYEALSLFLGATLALPTLTSPASSWAGYTGVYEDRWGWLGSGVEVTIDPVDGGGSSLFVNAPNATPPVSGPMQQEFPDTWVLPNGWEVSFFGSDAGPATYFATRLGVGVRDVDAGGGG